MKRRLFIITVTLICVIALSLVLIGCNENVTEPDLPQDGDTDVACTNHVPGDWITDTQATCTTNGAKHKECTVCHAVTETDTLPATGHRTSDWIIDTDATCEAEGTKHKECTVCHEPMGSDTIPVTEHGAGADGYCVHGDVIYFGSYPQSKVTDTTTLSTLGDLVNTLPTKSDNKGWTPYGYYIRSEAVNYMWYTDVETDGNKYRGVYFTSYRPQYNHNSSAQNSSYQYKNDYYVDEIYWFKYEPVKWHVYNKNNGKALLLADVALDSQTFYSSQEDRSELGATIYSNDYQRSTIREWLNDTFYNTAFTSLQKGLIRETVVDNSIQSTTFDTNKFACPDTHDNIFLLSCAEVKGLGLTEENGKMVSSDYAKSQGCYTFKATGESNQEYDGYCKWWLRSPSTHGSNCACYVDYDGITGYNYEVDYTGAGIIPALWIDIQ